MSITMGQLASRYAQAANKSKTVTSREVKVLSQVGVGLVKRAIQDVHAVDTSTMLNSTTAQSAGKDTYLIGPTVNYAAFVALGTSRMPARPFHTDAASELRKEINSFGFKPEDLGI